MDHPHRSRQSALTVILVFAGFVGTIGCRKEGGTQTAAPPPARTGSSGVPQVGQPFVTKDQYKPVVGKYGGRLIRSTLSDPKSFNPIVSSEVSTTDFTQRICQGLTESDPFTGEVKPLLAERWEVSSDGLTWTFYLRKDVTFND